MLHPKKLLRTFSVGVVAAALSACSGGEDGSNEELGQGSAAIAGDSAVLSTTEPGQLDDPRIVAILAAADTAEIAPSELAQSQGQSPEVVQFAAMMVRDHGMLSDSLRALAQTQGITPRPNRESELLQTQTRATLQSLESASGAAFDSAYVAAMVQSHEAALDLIDSKLLPGAVNPELRRALEQQVQPAVAAHLRQIQQIQTTVSSP